MSMHSRRRRLAAVGATLALAATGVVTVLLPTPALAALGTNLYDLTCGGNIAGNDLGPTPTPISITSTKIEPVTSVTDPNGDTTPAFPTGATVKVTGTVAVVVLGAVQAGVAATLAPPATIGVTAGSQIDVHASNSSTADQTIDLSGPAQPFQGRAFSASMTAGSTTVTSATANFTAADLGAAIGTNQLPAGTLGLALGSRIVNINSSTSVEVDIAAVGTQAAINTALAKDLSFVKTDVDLGSYTSNGIDGATMEFTAKVASDTAVNVQIGALGGAWNTTNLWPATVGPPLAGTPVGCHLLDNSDASLNPYGLVSNIPGANYGPFGSKTLSDPPPVIAATPLNFTVSSAMATSNIPITGSDTDATGISSWAISPVSAAGSATLSNTGAGNSTVIQYSPPASDFAGIETFELTASDGVTSTTVPVTIKVLAGDSLAQNVVQQVNAGVLDLLACPDPGPPVGAPDTDPDPADCDINMTPVDLDGTTQTSTGSINEVTVIDARGLPLDWSLTAQLAGPLTNGNTLLTGPNKQIQASNLSAHNLDCQVVDGNTDGGVADTFEGDLVVDTLDQAVTLCTAAAATGNGGTFTANADLELIVPASVYYGTYTGTINFIVA